MCCCQEIKDCIFFLYLFGFVSVFILLKLANKWTGCAKLPLGMKVYAHPGCVPGLLTFPGQSPDSL